VKWIVADATEWQPPETYDVWHDRAAFHVLTDEKEQNAYIQRLKQALLRGGHVIIGTFAPDGPEKCSGLPVARHSAESLSPARSTSSRSARRKHQIGAQNRKMSDQKWQAYCRSGVTTSAIVFSAKKESAEL
jgi:trans-aconitate methyltransferase